MALIVFELLNHELTLINKLTAALCVGHFEPYSKEPLKVLAF